MLGPAKLEGVYRMPTTRCHALLGDLMSFTDQIRAALAKKHAAQHPDAKSGESQEKVQPGRAPVVANKPQKKVTGRGR